MSKQPRASEQVCEEELVALANTFDLVLNPTKKRIDREAIKHFGLLVSLLKKLTVQVYG